jgi:hypothetical protein
MPKIAIQLLRFVDDHQPGFVEFELCDAYGHQHLFVEKIPVVTLLNVNSTSSFPISEKLDCTIALKRTSIDSTIQFEVDTTAPWGVVSNTNQSKFWVKSTALDFGSSTHKSSLIDQFAQDFTALDDEIFNATVQAFHAKDESSASNATYAMLDSVGNNHAGTYNTKVLHLFQPIEFILRTNLRWPIYSVIEALIDLSISFEPEATEPELRASFKTKLASLKSFLVANLEGELNTGKNVQVLLDFLAT